MTTDNFFARPYMPVTSLSDFSLSQPAPTPWAIPDLLPPGLTLMTGETRSGKTSLAYQFMFNVALGQSALMGADNLRAAPAQVLYLGLDISSTRLSKLCERFLNAHPGTTVPDNISITNTWKPLTPEEGLRELRDEFERYPNLRLLVIDNLKALRPLFKGNDRKLFALLRSIAERLGISVLVLHTSKASSSLVAHVDHHMHLKRLTLSDYYHFDVVGNSLAPTTHQLYSPQDGLNFRLTTAEENLALATHGKRKPMTPERVAILRLLDACEQSLTPSQIAEALRLDEASIKLLLRKMLKANQLCAPKRGHYMLSASIKPLLTTLFAQCAFDEPVMPSLIKDEEEVTAPTEIDVAEAVSTSREVKEEVEDVALTSELAVSLEESEPTRKPVGRQVAPVAAHQPSAPAQKAYVYRPNRAARRLARRKGRK